MTGFTLIALVCDRRIYGTAKGNRVKLPPKGDRLFGFSLAMGCVPILATLSLLWEKDSSSTKNVSYYQTHLDNFIGGNVTITAYPTLSSVKQELFRNSINDDCTNKIAVIARASSYLKNARRSNQAKQGY
ncbi:MAG TPA: hypothetical protein V6C91_20755 [Coleofasciculaceae cyanobacterium]